MNSVILYLMNEKGYYCLNKYIDSKGTLGSIKYIVSSRDLNVEKDYYDEIQKICENQGLTFYDRKKAPVITNETAFAIGWRWIIEAEKVIVFHDSLLPKYRGFNPVVTALTNGDSELGVTALLATENYDEGPIIGQEKLYIEYPIKIQRAIEKLSELYFKLFSEIISDLSSGNKLRHYLQDKDGITYSLWRDEEDYFIDWNKDANFIERFIDAVGYPYKGAASLANDEKVKILDAQVIEDVFIENRDVGKVIFVKNGFPVVVCGQGLLMLKNILDESGKSILPLKKFRVRFK